MISLQSGIKVTTRSQKETNSIYNDFFLFVNFFIHFKEIYMQSLSNRPPQMLGTRVTTLIPKTFCLVLGRHRDK